MSVHSSSNTWATSAGPSERLKRHVLATLAFVLPTFPLGYSWHLTIFASQYQALEVYRPEILIQFGILSMLIQGPIWSLIYSRLFAGEPVFRGALKFACLAIPFAWSYAVIVIAAKHRMTSVADFVVLETAFTVVHYAVCSPLIAAVYARRPTSG